MDKALLVVLIWLAVVIILVPTFSWLMYRWIYGNEKVSRITKEAAYKLMKYIRYTSDAKADWAINPTDSSWKNYVEEGMRLGEFIGSITEK